MKSHFAALKHVDVAAKPPMARREHLAAELRTYFIARTGDLNSRR